MSQQTFLPGQRWVSQAEPELGLGIVLEADTRRATLHFPAADADRIYAQGNAPLTRIRFQAGESIADEAGQSLVVTEVHDQSGLLVYHCINEAGESILLPETRLSAGMHFSRPQERLFTGHIDPPKWFELRTRTHLLSSRLVKSEVHGLVGPKVSLIPHQIFITAEVARRMAPRVLLADEVGLGKTIEAAMIIHQKLLDGSISRVLIITPEPLLHQWLVELLRRFNLRFSIVDESRFAASEEQSNSFLDVQLAISSLEFFMTHPQRALQATEAEWDLVVVDEAHHLAWSPTSSSPEYQFIEKLAMTTPGLLLLTATPEQLGRSAHFARLRLLDPARFHDLNAFVEEEHRYEPVANAAGKLLDQQELNATQVEWLQQALPDFAETLNDLQRSNSEARQRVIEALLDRHGVGRVLFRNTREAIGGFPHRTLHPVPLARPTDYAQWGQSGLYPERDLGESGQDKWTSVDTRVAWLVALCKQMPTEKILVICAHPDTAVQIEQAMRLAHGLRSAVFHEGMTMVARDRAAAWFAEPTDGAQCLVCSEIGSEGRNFQFSRHLVLFDLPLDPGLLEQRVGRLDRIGQQNAIHIHVPYFSASSQEILFRWYNEGMNAFSAPCAAGAIVYEETGRALDRALLHEGVWDDLLRATREITLSSNIALQRGRDRLLELHSCNPQRAQRLIEQIRNAEDIQALMDYLESIGDCYGLDIEEIGDDIYFVRPGDHMRITAFPSLTDEGFSFTPRRDIAITREDLQFLNWEHPLIVGAIDLISTSDTGSACVELIESMPDLPRGTLLLESAFTLTTSAPAKLNASRYFPASLIRYCQDNRGTDHTTKLENSALRRHSEALPQNIVSTLISSHRSTIESMLKTAEEEVKISANRLRAEAVDTMNNILGLEIQRLKALKENNPTIREDEITALEQQQVQLEQAISTATPRLDAVKLMLAA